MAVSGSVEGDLVAPERTRAQGWLAYQLEGELPEDRLVAFSDASVKLAHSADQSDASGCATRASGSNPNAL